MTPVPATAGTRPATHPACSGIFVTPPVTSWRRAQRCSERQGQGSGRPRPDRAKPGAQRARRAVRHLDHSSPFPDISKSTFENIGNFFGAVASVFIAIVTMPFILFYLLKDGKNLAPYAVAFLPTKWRKPTMKVLKEMNQQVSSYIRGQLTVAFLVGVIFMIGFAIIGLDYAVTLGIMAGILNLIPYLGSFLAMIPAVFLGIVGGPILLIKVLVVFLIEQTLEGRFISPLILGNQLSIHPITILFVLLTSGKMFGLTGVILGIPVYAAVKVLIKAIYAWYVQTSKLYEDAPTVLIEEPIQQVE